MLQPYYRRKLLSIGEPTSIQEACQWYLTLSRSDAIIMKRLSTLGYGERRAIAVQALNRVRELKRMLAFWLRLTPNSGAPSPKIELMIECIHAANLVVLNKVEEVSLQYKPCDETRRQLKEYMKMCELARTKCHMMLNAARVPSETKRVVLLPINTLMLEIQRDLEVVRESNWQKHIQEERRRDEKISRRSTRLGH